MKVKALTFLQKTIQRLSNFLLLLGGLIVLVQATWISYGVIVRYLFNNPDGMVTEATALLLFPVAFLGMAYALQKDAYPKVTIFIDLLKGRKKIVIQKINLLIMVTLGVFFTTAVFLAMVRAYVSEAASEILLWQKFYFWIPVFLSFLVFTLNTISLLITPSNKEEEK